MVIEARKPGEMVTGVIDRFLRSGFLQEKMASRDGIDIIAFELPSLEATY